MEPITTNNPLSFPMRRTYLKCLILSCIPFLISSVTPAAALSNKEKAGEYYIEGKKCERDSTPRGRMMAREAYQKAIDRDPENILYRMTIGRLYQTMNTPYNAIDIYKRVIKIDSTYSQAHLQLADLYTVDMEHFQDRYHDGLNLNSFADSIGILALSHYQTAASLAPENWEVINSFGVFSLKYNLNDEMIKCAQRLVKIDSAKSDGYFLMGVGFTQIGAYGYAHSSFDRAFDKLSEGGKISFMSLASLLSPAESDSYRSMDSESQARFERAFWRNLDPLYLTAYNERVLVHLSRVARADLLYGIPSRSIRGWDTDKGRVYIRYGEPRRVIKRTIAIKPPSGSLGLFDQQGFGYEENWIYPDFSLTFEDYYTVGEYRFKNTSLIKYGEVIDENPSNHQVDFTGNKFELPYVFSTFKDKEPDKSVLEIGFGAPLEQLAVNDSLNEAWVREGVFIFDKDYEPVLEVVDDKEYKLSPEPGERAGKYLINQGLITIPPGSYSLVVEVADRMGDNFGSQRMDLAIPSYEDKVLRLSDLTLADKVLDEKWSAFYRQDLETELNPLMQFSRQEDLTIYFGAYNMGLNDNGRTSYRTTFTISRIDPELERRSRFVKLLNRLLGEIEGFSITSDYSGTIPDEIRVLTIDLGHLKPGEYSMKVKVEDLIARDEAQKERIFWIID